MKRWTTICLALVLVLIAAAALAQPQIITPQEREILPVRGGMVTFEWVPQDEAMELFVVDERQEALVQTVIEPGAAAMQIQASGLLQEGKPYMLILMLGDDFATVSFGVDMGGGRSSNVDWSAIPSGSSASNGASFGLIQFNTENLEGLAKKMVDMYNAIIESFSGVSEGYSLEGVRGVSYLESEEGALLGPVFLHLNNPNGFFPYSEKLMINFTDQIFEILQEDYRQLRELGYLEDDSFPMFTNRYVQLMEGTLDGGMAIEPLHYYTDEMGVSLMLFGITDEKGNVLLDENIYGHFCVMDSSGKLISLLITEQEDIAKLIEEMGIDKDALVEKLPQVMKLGFTQERLKETLKELVIAGTAQKEVKTSTGTDYHSAARDEQSAVGQRYKAILWEKIDSVYDAVLDLLIKEKTQEALAPDMDWQMAMYKGIIYEMLGQNTEGIGETTAIVSEYLKALREAYQLADKVESVNSARDAMVLPQEESWARMLGFVLESTDVAAQGDEDLTVIACMIAEQAANEAVLEEIVLSVGAQSTLGSVCAEVEKETKEAFTAMVKMLNVPAIEAISDMEAGKRVKELINVTASTLTLAEMNAHRSMMSDVYAMHGVSVVMEAMEAALPIGDRLIQLSLIREDLLAMVEAAYQAEDEKGDALYTLTKLYLIAEESCLAATESYFASVESSWFASTFMHETVTDAKSAQAAVDASREEVEQTSAVLRDQRKQNLNERQKESNVALGRKRTAVVNTNKSPLTMTTQQEKKGRTICEIPKGSTVVVLEEGQWPFVEYNGKQGYVNGQYLK